MYLKNVLLWFEIFLFAICLIRDVILNGTLIYWIIGLFLYLRRSINFSQVVGTEIRPKNEYLKGLHKASQGYRLHAISRHSLVMLLFIWASCSTFLDRRLCAGSCCINSPWVWFGSGTGLIRAWGCANVEGVILRKHFAYEQRWRDVRLLKRIFISLIA